MLFKISRLFFSVAVPLAITAVCYWFLHVNADAASQIARHIVRLFGFDNAVIFSRYSSTFHCGGEIETPSFLHERLKEIAASGAVEKNEKERLLIAPIRLGAEPIGSLATQGPLLSDGAQQALLNLIAIALERERQREETTQAQAEQKSERLKSALLDAIAHEFKTPLTSIKAAATSLVSSSLLLAREDTKQPPLASWRPQSTKKPTGLPAW